MSQKSDALTQLVKLLVSIIYTYSHFNDQLIGVDLNLANFDKISTTVSKI